LCARGLCELWGKCPERFDNIDETQTYTYMQLIPVCHALTACDTSITCIVLYMFAQIRLLSQ